MKYAVIQCVNGNFSIVTEGFTDKAKAIVSYHGVAKTLWNASDVETADVMLVDEHLMQIDIYHEHIDNTSKPNESENAFPI